jgi:DNA repair exonuclease SbcCD ATPase subunit
MDEVEDREALLHAREESADSHAESLSLQEARLAVREAKVRERERELRLREEQLQALEDWLTREREALESREEMVSRNTAELSRHHKELQQREDSLQERMDRMLVQWRVAEYVETCCTDFRSKTDTALARYKQMRDTLERKVRDLEAERKEMHEVRRGAERALTEADATIRTLQGDVKRLEEEGSAMVQQIVEIS